MDKLHAFGWLAMVVCVSVPFAAQAQRDTGKPKIVHHMVWMPDAVVRVDIQQSPERRNWWVGCSVVFRGQSTDSATDLSGQQLPARSPVEKVEFSLPRRGTEMPEKYIVRVWGQQIPDKTRSLGYRFDNEKDSTGWQDIPVGTGNPGVSLRQQETVDYTTDKQGDLQFVSLQLLSPGAFAGPADSIIAGQERLDIVAKVKILHNSIYLLANGIHSFLYKVILPNGSVEDASKYFVVPAAREENYRVEHTQNIWNINRDLLIQAGEQEVKEQIQSRGNLPVGEYVLIVGIRARRWTTTDRGMEFDEVYMRRPFRIIGR